MNEKVFTHATHQYPSAMVKDMIDQAPQGTEDVFMFDPDAVYVRYNLIRPDMYEKIIDGELWYWDGKQWVMLVCGTFADDYSAKRVSLAELKKWFDALETSICEVQEVLPDMFERQKVLAFAGRSRPNEVDCAFAFVALGSYRIMADLITLYITKDNTYMLIIDQQNGYVHYREYGDMESFINTRAIESKYIAMFLNAYPQFITLLDNP